MPSTTPGTALAPDALLKRCAPDSLGFATTADLEDLPGLAGQARAMEAVRFGTGIERPGFNLFVLGAPGSGAYDAVRRYLEENGKRAAEVADWAYVHDFETGRTPVALKLRPGRGRELRDGMAELVDDLKTAIPAIFESEEYTHRREAIDEAASEAQQQGFERVRTLAEEKGIAVLRTPTGFALAPVRDGEVMKPEVFNELPEDERKSIEETIKALEKELAAAVETMPKIDKDRRAKLRELNREMADAAVGSSISDLAAAFAGNEGVAAFLERAREDMISNAHVFAGGPGGEGGGMPEGPAALMAALRGVAGRGAEDDPFARYEVNLIVDNGDRAQGDEPAHAPIVYDDHPTLQSLVGRVEHRTEMGALVTDFSLVRAGSLHRANGGFLLLDARKVLTQPFAWDALKRALRARQVKIETPAEFLNLVSTLSLEPDPVPLDVKVMLFGEPMLYYMLCALDPEFEDLFKVQADFDDVTPRGAENDALYARFIATVARRHGMRPLDAGAVARVIERASRLAGDAERVTLHAAALGDLVQEADYFAGEAGAATVEAGHVDAAIAAQIARADRLRERTQESIARDIVLIDTAGEAVGQINGLSVLSLGGFAFGRPTRLTAQVRIGAGAGTRVIDIEREVELGGPLHSKGVLILQGYLAGRLLPDTPVALSASLVFEQSYGGVDGDSASAAELFALLSALAEIPLAQRFAVTGSINQKGEIQPIGGVNEKIEGFFDVCRARGLTGDQGVLIPRANVQHLMLRADVVEAVAEGKFHVHALATVEEGLALLTGRAAEEVFAAAEARLQRFAEARRAYARDGEAAPAPGKGQVE